MSTDTNPPKPTITVDEMAKAVGVTLRPYQAKFLERAIANWPSGFLFATPRKIAEIETRLRYFADAAETRPWDHTLGGQHVENRTIAPSDTARLLREAATEIENLRTAITHANHQAGASRLRGKSDHFVVFDEIPQPDPTEAADDTDPSAT